MKRQRKKYLRPSHPWVKERMDSEGGVLRQFGLQRKEEIWRAEPLLRDFRKQAINLLAASGQQAEKETKQLLARLRGLGLVLEENTLDDILGLSLNKLLDRRLQTVVQRKGLARTMRQARQLVVHGHIAISGRRIDVPSYLVPLSEESQICYAGDKKFEDIQPEDTHAITELKEDLDTKAEPVPVETDKEVPKEGVE